MMREFCKEDWYGYAGAEKFADGSEPKIATVPEWNGEIDVLASAGAIEVYFYAHNDDTVLVYHKEYTKETDRYIITTQAEEIATTIEEFGEIPIDEAANKVLENYASLEFEVIEA